VRKTAALAIGLFGLAAGSTGAEAEGVEVLVNGVRDARGHILVAVCPPQDFLRLRCPYNASAPARPGTLVVRVAGVPPGTYAVQAWHDENDHGRLTRDWLGIPREGVGFSRDPSLLLGPPGFNDAEFPVGPGGGQAALRLRYLKGQN
jgi:uncharacterized protein (DUF2141 family)